MIKRIFWKKHLPEISQRWRLICIAGPRQVGKTTFLKQEGSYFSFDDPKLRREIQPDPVHWLETEFLKGNRIILDEATRLPDLFDAMKILSDKYPAIKGRIWFASSSNYQLNMRIRESLAGRAFLYQVSPFLLSELEQNSEPAFYQWLLGRKIARLCVDPKRYISTALRFSLFPDPFLSKDETLASEWLKQYITTYILQDLVEGFPRTDFAKWQAFIGLLFSYPAQIIPLNRIASPLEIHHHTAKQYLSMAIASHLCQELPVYSASTLKRITKGPKYVMIDSALCRAVSGNISEGPLLENFALSQILGFLNSALIPYKAYHWRTADEAEVDLVLEGDFGIVPIEIKTTREVTLRMLSGIKSFLEAHPKAKRGCLFYQGSEVKKIGNIACLPLSTLFC